MCVMKFMLFGRRLKATVLVRRHSTKQGYISTGMLFHSCMKVNCVYVGLYNIVET